jgi:hypothetical protein
LRTRFEEDRNISILESCGQHFSCFYDKPGDSFLNSLCDKYGSDKGEVSESGHPFSWPAHSYADFYERLFGHCRLEIKNVFECGLGTNNPNMPSNMTASGKPGASLRVWREYFPNAYIYGADIDREILFVDERINTFYCDQTDILSIASVWNQIKDVKFCVIIDDGLHTFEAGVSLFENSFFMLRNGGIYIIEDVNIRNARRFKDYFNSKKLHCDIVSFARRGYPFGEWSIVMVRR